MISFFIKIVEIIVLYKRVLTISKDTVECKRELYIYLMSQLDPSII